MKRQRTTGHGREGVDELEICLQQMPKTAAAGLSKDVNRKLKRGS